MSDWKIACICRNELTLQIAEARAAGKSTEPVERILSEVRLELEAVLSGNGPPGGGGRGRR